MITKNEESQIERCLSSVPWAAEKIVVDSFSTDKTVEIAEKMGTKVYEEAWRGFGPQKAFATTKASHEWVLSLDADEALSPELSEEIQNQFRNLNSEAGYELNRRSFHLGRWITHESWYPDRQLRLFNKKHSQWSDSVLHEKIQTQKVLRLQGDILHWVFDGVSDQVIADDRYSTLGAEKLLQKGDQFSVLKMFVKPPIKFFECYFLKLGFLDGLPGFIIAIGASYYSIFLRYAKIWEKRMRSR